MKRHELTLENIGCFRGLHHWDLTQYPDGVGVVVAPNGKGKTTLVEGMATLAIWGESPYYNRSLIKRITRGEQSGFAQVVVEASDGAIYRSRIAADKKSRKTTYHLEQLVDDEWRPMAGPSKAVHRAAVDRLFGSYEQMLCGPFKDQRNTGSLLTAPRAERRARFAEMLQLDSLESLADMAKDKAKAHDSEIDAWRAKRDGAQARVEDAGRLRDEIEAAERVALQESEALAAIDAEVESASASHRAAEDRRLIAKTKIDAVVAERKRLIVEHDATIEAENAAMAELRRSDEDLTSEAAVLAAVTALPELEEKCRVAQQREKDLNEQIRALAVAESDVQRAEAVVADVEQRLAHATRDLDAAQATIAGEEEVAAAVSAVSRLEAELQARRTDLAAQNARATELASDVATRRATLLELGRRYKTLGEQLAAAEAAEQRVAEAGEIDVEAAQAEVASATAVVAQYETEVEAAKAKADAEADEERARKSAEADRTKALPRVQALGSIDLTHPMCSSCPLTADARNAKLDVDRAAAILDQPPVPNVARQGLIATQQRLLNARQAERNARAALGTVQARAREHAVDASEAAKLVSLRGEYESLGADGRAQKADMESAEKSLADVAATAEALQVEVDTLDADLRSQRTTAARQAVIDEAKARIPDLKSLALQQAEALKRARQDAAADQGKVREILGEQTRPELEATRATAASEAEAAENELQAARRSAARKEVVESARKRRPALEEALRAAQRRRDAAVAAIQGVEDVEPIETFNAAVAMAAESLEAARARKAAAQASLDAARDRAASRRGAFHALGDPQADLTAAEGQLAALQQDAEDWQLLQRSLGPDGLQAILIDLAGPEVTERCNELLGSFYGQRFSVEIITSAPKSKGKGTKEVFEIRIIDSEFPPDPEMDDAGEEIGSGGEMVFIDEALSLAVAMYNAERSGIDHLTLYRDEATGALDGARAAQYMTMLRKARELGGFAQVWTISHHPHVWSQGDFQIFLDGADATAADGHGEAA